MQDPNLNIISAFKFEKRIQIFVAVYLSVILLSIVFILVRIDMTAELQQVLVVVLGLIAIATLDAFKKALDTKSFPITSVGNQIIIREGGVYVGGDYVGGSINHAIESKQTLAEAAVEIHKLLQELEKFNPTATEAEKVAYVDAEVTPAFKSRVASAVKATGETEASIEIQQLLQQLEDSDSALNESGTKVSPTLKSRLANALRAGGEVAMESFLDNPYSTVTLAIVKGWMSAYETEQPTQHNNPSAAN